ncbi:MAG: hypothetical protein J6K53_05190 [Roseburia sp.]|nr:hypothetical protein [Roseburia sp.]
MGRVIVPDEICRQADDMTENFRGYKDALSKLIVVMEQFAETDTLQGVSWESMREHFSNHKTVLQGMLCVISQGIEDACTLKQCAGDELLDEEEINEQIRKLTMRNQECQESIGNYQRLLCNPAYAGFLGWWARWMIANYEEEIDTNHRMITLLEQKLERIEEIDAQTRCLFGQDLSPYILQGIEALEGAWNGNGFTVQTNQEWMRVINEAWTDHVKEGTRIGLKEDGYVAIVGADGTVYYGGDQGWFASEDILLKNYGCGIIATVNLMLYMSGRTNLTQEEYMQEVREFLEDDWSARKELDNEEGYYSISMMLYTNQYFDSHEMGYTTMWKLTQDDMLDKMQEMLSNNLPVILDIGDGEQFGGEIENRIEKGKAKKEDDEEENEVVIKRGIPFYKYQNGQYVFVQNCQEHYVTVTGIREYDGTDGEHQIMLEISTWGKKYYMDYDEYKAFIELQKKDSGLLNQMWENAYNNILYIKEEENK